MEETSHEKYIHSFQASYPVADLSAGRTTSAERRLSVCFEEAMTHPVVQEMRGQLQGARLALFLGRGVETLWEQGSFPVSGGARLERHLIYDFTRESRVVNQVKAWFQEPRRLVLAALPQGLGTLLMLY